MSLGKCPRADADRFYKHYQRQPDTVLFVISGSGRQEHRQLAQRHFDKNSRFADD